MKLALPRLTIALLGASLMLAGCANHPARSGSNASQPQATTETRPAPSTRTQPPENPADHNGRATTTSTPEEATQLPDSTGVPACDDYLASYVACHRAAEIYKPDQIQGHYEAMRTSLLRDAQDPAIRPNLAARCNSLAGQLRQALHGKSCQATPAASASQAGD